MFLTHGVYCQSNGSTVAQIVKENYRTYCFVFLNIIFTARSCDRLSSVSLSVTSVTLVDCDHIGYFEYLENERLMSLRLMLGLTPI